MLAFPMKHISLLKFSFRRQIVFNALSNLSDDNMTTHFYKGDAPFPEIPGLRFRNFKGPEDYSNVADVRNASKEEDNLEGTLTVEDLENAWSHLTNCDPEKDILIVEKDGEAIGTGRNFWIKEHSGPHRYVFYAQLKPEWRGKGIRKAMVSHFENRLSEIAKNHKSDEKFYEVTILETENEMKAILENAGYEIARYGANMVRPNLEDIPNLELPKGLELRRPEPKDYKRIFMAHIDAFRESWGFSEHDWDEEFVKFKNGKLFQPELWQIAWDADVVAGQVKPFILEDENEEMGRKRAYIEFISTSKPYRRKGLARALIAKALRRVKEEGMEEAALGVDTENVHGALDLYRKLGFRKDKLWITYRKPLPT